MKRRLSRRLTNGIPDACEVGRAWHKAGQVQWQIGKMQDARPNGNALPANLLLGFKPISEGIAFASGVPTLQKNLVRPAPDLLMRTDADTHGFLLPFLAEWWNARWKLSTSGTFPGG